LNSPDTFIFTLRFLMLLSEALLSALNFSSYRKGKMELRCLISDLWRVAVLGDLSLEMFWTSNRLSLSSRAWGFCPTILMLCLKSTLVISATTPETFLWIWSNLCAFVKVGNCTFGAVFSSLSILIRLAKSSWCDTRKLSKSKSASETRKYCPEIGGAHLAELNWAKSLQLLKDNRSHSSIHDFKNPTNKNSQLLEVNRKVGCL
jgi:hypothetical protein